jgi:hypothetical protein
MDIAFAAGLLAMTTEVIGVIFSGGGSGAKPKH